MSLQPIPESISSIPCLNKKYKVKWTHLNCRGRERENVKFNFSHQNHVPQNKIRHIKIVALELLLKSKELKVSLEQPYHTILAVAGCNQNYTALWFLGKWIWQAFKSYLVNLYEHQQILALPWIPHPLTGPQHAMAQTLYQPNKVHTITMSLYQYLCL